jgi:SAM-dependent methyltransferase
MEKQPEENNKNEVFDWGKYYELVKDASHSGVLEKAIEQYAPQEGYALDMGAGNLRDTKYLLQKGYTVTAIDSSPLSIQMAQNLDNPNLEMFGDVVGNYSFPPEHFSIVNAQGLLFHFQKPRFLFLIQKIYETLKKGGVLSANFIGEKHSWNYEATSKTIVNKKELEEILEGFEIVFLKEFEEDESEETVKIKGKEKPTHWHAINVIAVKK